MKSDTDPVLRRPSDLLRMVASKDARDRNGALTTYVDKFESFAFTKLDTTTGNLALPVSDDLRYFEGTIDLGSDQIAVSWQLPNRVAGGYWRTPDVLQIAFWESHRPRLWIPIPNSGRTELIVECIVISTDSIRIVTGGSETPDVLVRFDGCE
jgi:hypothetical protein